VLFLCPGLVLAQSRSGTSGREQIGGSRSTENASPNEHDLGLSRQLPSAERLADIRKKIIEVFGDRDVNIQITGAVKGGTAVGYAVESKGDVAVIRDPCNTDSAHKPIIFQIPYLMKRIGMFTCASGKEYPKYEVEQQ
jgi:hypothetical protein